MPVSMRFAACSGQSSILSSQLPGLSSVEVDVDNGYTDIVTGRYDAGVRLGQEVAGDMIAVRIGPDWYMAVVATPDYLREHGAPKSPMS